MNLLASNFLPLDVAESTFTNRWEELFSQSKTIKIAVGYATNDSLLHLQRLLELNEGKYIQICLGMAFFDGLSKSQFEAAQSFDAYLKSDSRGQIFISRLFPFHGKLYSFGNGESISSVLLGSSNLNNIVPTQGIRRKAYEIDVEISDSGSVTEASHFIDRLISEGSSPFAELKSQIKIRPDINPLLNSRNDVGEIGPTELRNIQDQFTNIEFNIPLKDTSKSNLNVYHGKGRKNKQGFIKPRSWYEVEIIVGVALRRAKRGYPSNKSFWAYTDDGFRFVMYTGGSGSKNIRSKYDLTILGRWIKGRLEQAEILKSGQVITSNMLQNYGRSSISLKKTKMKEPDPNSNELLDVWFLDFDSERAR